MEKFNKVLKIIQFVLIGLFVSVFLFSVVQMIRGTAIISYNVVGQWFAYIFIAFVVTFAIKVVMSVVLKLKKSNSELAVTGESHVYGPSPSASDPDHVPFKLDPDRQPIPPTPDDPYTEPLVGEYNVHSDDHAVFIDDTIETLSALSDRIERYALENGCTVKTSAVNAMLSAMSVSHLIFVKGLDSKALSGLLSVFNGAFGSITDYSNGFGGEAGLSYNLLKSIDDKNVINMQKPSAESFEAFMQTYSHILPCLPTVYSHLDRASKNVRGSESAILSNIFFVCPIGDEMDIYQMPRELANASVITELAPSDVVIGTQGLNVVSGSSARIDGNFFSELVRTAASENGISLPTWNKFDKLCALLENDGKPLFGNIQNRQMERFVSAEMALGSEEQAAFDKMLVCKVIPMISENIRATIGTDTVISDSIESIFGSDSLPLTQNEIVKLSASFIQNSQGV